MNSMVWELVPGSAGLPNELYVFTRPTKWDEYECEHAKIVDHLLAAAAYFKLAEFPAADRRGFCEGIENGVSEINPSPELEGRFSSNKRKIKPFVPVPDLRREGAATPAAETTWPGTATRSGAG